MYPLLLSTICRAQVDQVPAVNSRVVVQLQVSFPPPECRFGVELKLRAKYPGINLDSCRPRVLLADRNISGEDLIDVMVVDYALHLRFVNSDS